MPLIPSPLALDNFSLNHPMPSQSCLLSLGPPPVSPSQSHVVPHFLPSSALGPRPSLLPPFPATTFPPLLPSPALITRKHSNARPKVFLVTTLRLLSPYYSVSLPTTSTSPSSSSSTSTHLYIEEAHLCFIDIHFLSSFRTFSFVSSPNTHPITPSFISTPLVLPTFDAPPTHTPPI